MNQRLHKNSFRVYRRCKGGGITRRCSECGSEREVAYAAKSLGGDLLELGLSVGQSNVELFSASDDFKSK